MVKYETLQSPADQSADYLPMSLIRIATRNSPLALWQANFVKDQLQLAHPDLQVEIVGMTTKGDQLLDRSLNAVGGKGLFLKELQVSLLEQTTDIAVHSMKDVPVNAPEGLKIAVVCERADPRDALISNEYQNLYALPQGARVGTGSLRRVSQLKSAFPTLEFVELRGNVNSRLAKLDACEFDAIVLAAAGLIRLGFVHRIKKYITPELCLPAVGQGIVGIECRSHDHQTLELLRPLHNADSAMVLAAERSMNRVLEGGCQMPVAGFAELEKGKLRMRGMVAAEDGSQVLFCNMIAKSVSLASAEELGENVAKELISQGAGDIIASVYDAKKDSQADVTTEQGGNGMAVLLTRQTRYLGNMVPILERLDYKPLHLPTLEVEQMVSEETLQRIANLDDYTDIVFVSRNAVEIGMNVIQRVASMPAGIRALTVGAETAKQLYRYGIDAMFPDRGSGAQALLGVGQLADLSGRKMLIVRGKVGLDWPEQEMRNRGAQVDRAIVYSQNLPRTGTAELQKALRSPNTLAGVFVHSVQSVTNLMKLAGSDANLLTKVKMVAGSERIAEAARKFNWQGEILVAESPSNKHMMITFSG